MTPWLRHGRVWNGPLALGEQGLGTHDIVLHVSAKHTRGE